MTVASRAMQSALRFSEARWRSRLLPSEKVRGTRFARTTEANERFSSICTEFQESNSQLPSSALTCDTPLH
jgi:hypothetical protein